MDQSTFEYAQIDSVATVRQASAHYVITRSAANFAAILDAEVPDGPDKTHLMRLAARDGDLSPSYHRPPTRRQLITEISAINLRYSRCFSRQLIQSSSVISG